MDKMIYLYLFAIAILITIYISIKSQKQNNLKAVALFSEIVLLSIVMMSIDIFHEFLGGIPGAFNAITMRMLSLLIFALPSVIALIWYEYSYLLIYRKTPKNKLYYLSLVPMVVNILIAFLSLIWPLYFSIDSNNVYSRGSIFNLSIFLQYFYLILPIILVSFNRKRISDAKFYPMIFFTIPPMIGGLIQAFYYGLLLIWPLLAFSIFVGYVFIQSKLMAVDYLTGLMNKGAFENHLENISYHNKKKMILSLALIDLDGLKTINDYHGHLLGDRVLTIFSEHLINTFDRNDFLARVGGDEFIIIKYVNEASEMENALKNLSESLNKFNETKILPFSIKYSCGWDVYSDSMHYSIKDLLAHVDKIMYERKAGKKDIRL